MKEDRPTRALSVLIVTCDSAPQIVALLDALHVECRQLDAEVIVLDNASRDGTPELIERSHGWVSLQRSITNLGFAVAANLAARLASGRCLLLLQPDAVPEPGCLARGLAMMRADPRVALAGGRLLEAPGATPGSTRLSRLHDAVALSGLAARHPKARPFGRFDRCGRAAGQPADVDWVSGAFLFVSAEAFGSLGGFDERFFLYYEEIDLCRRARLAGWRVCHWPALQARYAGSPAAHDANAADEAETLIPDSHFPAALNAAPASRLALWHIRSGLLYHRKHHGWAAAWTLNRLERVWQRLQAWRNARRHRIEQAEDAVVLLAQLRRAWDDTFGGRVSPPRPW